jgi:exo-1,4-beta-D-glucosaminidase
MALIFGWACSRPNERTTPAKQLTEDWFLQATAEVTDEPTVVSSPEFDIDGWYSTKVPSTPMAALVAHGLYPDLYLGTHLEDVDIEPFRGPWWYRTEIFLTPDEAARHAQLVFEGINYSAEVWLNGTQIAGRDSITGAFRVHELEVPGGLRPGPNVLAVKVFPPEPGDFTIGFVDWNPHPPDLNMGIWRPVVLRLTGDVSVDHLFVRTDVDTETLNAARITVSARVRNLTLTQVNVVITGQIEEISFASDIILDPKEERIIEFTPDTVTGLKMDSPRLWWPHTLGTPELYTAEISATIDGRSSDTTSTTFGIREFATSLNDEGHRGYTVNGVPILIRGGGWVDDLLLSNSPEMIEAQIAYVKQMHLNTIRLEGFWGSGQTLYDIADREGVLVMPGWSCQWEWAEYLGKAVDETYGGVLEPDEMNLVARSLGDQVNYLRNHPSIFTWAVGSDLQPHPDLERKYQAVLSRADPTRPALVSCASVESEVSGPSGVKMNGPYDWVPPVYWWSDTENGGAFGFNTETGPGPQPPPLESISKMIPEDHLWPIDEVWNFHCGRNEFNTMDRYVQALDRRYGPSDSVEEFLQKAQVASYEAIRPMFESFASKRPTATGVIQWMLNSAWPETFWQLYDWYLMPNGAFYGTRTACQPITLSFDYDLRTVNAVNDSRNAALELQATVRAFDLSSTEFFNTNVTLSLNPGSSITIVNLDTLHSPTPVFFLDLRLRDSVGTEVARNFYWLSTKPDILDTENAQWFTTPTIDFADFTSLEELPKVDLNVTASVSNGTNVRVHISNPSKSLAFFIELAVTDRDGNTILPVLWDDNFISILPGDQRNLTAQLPPSGDLGGSHLVIRGWNSPRVEVQLEVN